MINFISPKINYQITYLKLKRIPFFNKNRYNYTLKGAVLMENTGGIFV